MSDFNGLESGIRVDKIITKSIVRDILREADEIFFIRSGVYPALGHCADIIEEVCNASETKKDIHIILPDPFNPDVPARAREVGRSAAEVIADLEDWLETLAALGNRLSQLPAKHVLELRTTMNPHRYHAIFTAKQGILGVPWYTKASLSTSSFFIAPAASQVLQNLHEDFYEYNRLCRPYEIGDCARARATRKAHWIDDEVLQEFGALIPWVIDALLFINSAFPDANGNGVTKDHLHAKFNTDKADCNKRLLAMEDAGYLKRSCERGVADPRHGRLITKTGKLMATKYEHMRLLKHSR